tara:strand:+ start:5936 stop:6163 length:228 start_codon:yes stop_codon:yes gene_type:complete
MATPHVVNCCNEVAIAWFQCRSRNLRAGCTPSGALEHYDMALKSWFDSFSQTHNLLAAMVMKMGAPARIGFDKAQ